MKKKSSENILYVVTILLIVLTILLCANYPVKKGLYFFLLVFGIAYWQRKWLQDFFQRLKNPTFCTALYILTGWIWAIFLEYNSWRLAFSPKPIANLIIGLGFYLPYFAIWLKVVNRYKFSFFETFYLSGFSRLIFDLLITRKLLISSVVTTNIISALIVFIIQTTVSLVLFGSLTTLPVLYLKASENRHHDKPLKEYLIGMAPIFLATGVFILWSIILKILFTKA